jgi:hypothetical protein
MSVCPYLRLQSTGAMMALFPAPWRHFWLFGGASDGHDVELNVQPVKI